MSSYTWVGIKLMQYAYLYASQGSQVPVLAMQYVVGPAIQY